MTDTSHLQGDWRGISDFYVPTRTPTQVASHAQKHFLRQTNSQKRKRRMSLFDIVPERQVSCAVQHLLRSCRLALIIWHLSDRFLPPHELLQSGSCITCPDHAKSWKALWKPHYFSPDVSSCRRQAHLLRSLTSHHLKKLKRSATAHRQQSLDMVPQRHAKTQVGHAESSCSPLQLAVQGLAQQHTRLVPSVGLTC